VPFFYFSVMASLLSRALVCSFLVVLYLKNTSKKKEIHRTASKTNEAQMFYLFLRFLPNILPECTPRPPAVLHHVLGWALPLFINRLWAEQSWRPASQPGSTGGCECTTLQGVDARVSRAPRRCVQSSVIISRLPG
jgi:hypothetical protein